MKRISLFLFIILIIVTSCSRNWQYLEQVPPGERPEVFAPGIISGIERIHSFPAISQNGKQILWMTLPPKIWEVHYSNGEWSKPAELAPLAGQVCLRPGFHPDGSLLFSSASIPGGYGSLDIWYLDDDNIPRNLGAPVNTENIETAHSFTEKGDIYYTSYVQGKKWDRGIVYAKWKNGTFADPQPLPDPINTPDINTIDYLSFIAPDGSFILFCSNRYDTSKETCRLYVSFKNKNGIWSDAVDLNSIMGYTLDSRDPALSPDGKYLFFSSGRNIMWVSSDIIKKAKEE